MKIHGLGSARKPSSSAQHHYTAVEMVEFCELFNYQWGIWHSTCASVHNFGMLIEKLVRQLGRNNAADV